MVSPSNAPEYAREPSGTSAVVVRRARQEDFKHVDDVHRIINAAYRSAGRTNHEAQLIKKERISIDGVKKAMQDDVNPLLLAFNSETHQLLGTLQLRAVEFYVDFGTFEKEGYAPTYKETLSKDQQIILSLLAVDPLLQSTGVGGKLVDTGLRYARETMGRQQAVVYVNHQRTNLLGWYQRLGFIDHGEKLPDPNHPNRTDIYFSVLRLPL